MRPVFDHTVARRYDAFCSTPLGTYVDAVERSLLLPLLELHPGLRVADLGCGTGAYTILLANAGCRVLGVDASDAMLSVARQKPAPAGLVEWVRGDVQSLALDDATFDRVLVQVTLEFVHHPQRALHEAWRLVRPSGLLVVGCILAHGPWAEHYRRRACHEPTSVWRHARFWTPTALADWIGREPERVDYGLWVAPHEFTDPDTAWLWERNRATAPGAFPASFAAVRWTRPRA
jgi:ubiquinone/menaquinone biosynthesis C-methylase UbiE